MMLKKLPFAFSVVAIFFLNISYLKADLESPNNLILPAEVIKIQLVGLMTVSYTHLTLPTKRIV